MSKEAMKLALEALKQIDEAMPFPVAKLAQAALREALAEQPAQDEPVAWISTGPARMIHWTSDIPAYGDDWIPLYTSPPAQQEPVAWMHPDGRIWTFGRGLDKSTFTIPLYTSPPAQRTWVGLTDEERNDLLGNYITAEGRARAIEAKLKEKNT